MVFVNPSELPNSLLAMPRDIHRTPFAFRVVKLASILLVTLIVFAPSIRAQDSSVSVGARAGQSSESRQVWVNTASGVYHYPGTRWYGNTKQGKFISEADARAQGYRPAKNGQ
jgi:hypothetical protein